MPEMSLPKIIWQNPEHTGLTSDGYKIVIWRGPRSGLFILKIEPPRGCHLAQACSSVDAARCNAETEIEHHRRRGKWTE